MSKPRTRAYIDAIRFLAETGNAADALFVRLSFQDCVAVSCAVRADPALRAAALHPNCRGLVDTYILQQAAC